MSKPPNGPIHVKVPQEIDWADEKAKSIWGDLACDDSQEPYDTSVIAGALRDAEARGMEKAAKEITRITKIANKNAEACEGLSQEIDRLRAMAELKELKKRRRAKVTAK